MALFWCLLIYLIKGGNFVEMNEERNIAGVYIRVSTEDQAL